jgi:hypothetical protein
MPSPPSFTDDVRRAGQLDEGLAPAREYLFATMRVGSDAERRADVIENDRRVGEAARKVGEQRDLMMEEPGIESHAQRSRVRQSPARKRGSVIRSGGGRRTP